MKYYLQVDITSYVEWGLERALAGEDPRSVFEDMMGMLQVPAMPEHEALQLDLANQLRDHVYAEAKRRGVKLP